MKRTYRRDKVAFAHVLDWGGDEADVQTVFVRVGHRLRGHGRELMREILADADAEQKVLLLTSGIGREGALSTEELVAWYARLGFDVLAPDAGGATRMQRAPRVPAAV